MEDNNNSLMDDLIRICTKENIKVDEPMSLHTTFRTGGKADFYITPSNVDMLKELITIKDKYNVPFTVFGNGSNTLVTDKGIRGIVISLKGLNEFIPLDDDGTFKVGGGIPIAMLSNYAAEHSFSGLEYACGIPGTIGGAVYMNAGAYGGETKDIIKEVTYLSLGTGDIKTINNEECKFEYRSSVFHSLKNTIIVSAIIKLNKGEKEEILAKMKENMTSRNAKQPVNLPSAGSTFRREEGIVVAKLIDEAGLKGYKIGGAEVSKLHAGFIVNTDNATSQDILELIEYIKKVIKEKYNVELHEEVKIIGER